MNETPSPARKIDPIRDTDAEAIGLAKLLIRTARYGALAALDPADGAPLASRAAVATDHDGAPLILVSTLSAHTGALVADARCSLLVGEPGKGDPLAHPRITLSCRAERLDRDSEPGKRAARRYLARHPKAKLYADFADFSYFRLDPLKASLNGGFGKAYLLGRAELMTDSPARDAIAAMEEGAIAHMNEDHRDAIAVYARRFAQPAAMRVVEAEWTISGLDADGVDLAAGDLVARVAFPAPLRDAAEVRPALVRLAKDGRAMG